MNLATYSISATEVVSGLQRNRVDHVVTVPDWVQLSLHQRLHEGVPGIRLINCSNENQCLTVAAGLQLGGRRPLLVMQNQGLYNCTNTLRAVGLDAHIPLVLMVGQFGREYANFGHPSTSSRRVMVNLLEPLLNTLGVPYHRLETPADLTAMDIAFTQAEKRNGPVALLVGAPMSWN